MKISPINNSQNFKGLWGHDEYGCINNNVNNIFIKSKNYYPFKDETIDDIEKIERFYKRSYDSRQWEDYGMHIRNEVIVRTKNSLSFTKAEFENYKQNGTGAKNPKEITLPIERELVSGGLYEYLNNSDEYMNALKKHSSFKHKLRILMEKLKLKF